MMWDFITSRQETTYAILIHFSDQGTPDGYRHMNGFGLNTFKMVNANCDVVYVKFHYLVSSTPSLFPICFFNTRYCLKKTLNFYSFFKFKTIVIQTTYSRYHIVHNIRFSGVMIGRFMPRLVEYILKIP